MAVEPDVVKEAEHAIRRAYNEECHVAANAVLTKVKDGAIASDGALWDAIQETHQVRVDGKSVTPAWTPLLFSRHRFDTPARSWDLVKDSDVLWDLNRAAWVTDVCHVLNEHHGMPVAGVTRELFLSAHPLDALTSHEVTVQRALSDLTLLSQSIGDVDVRAQLLTQIARLNSLHRPKNPSLLESSER